LLRLDVLSRTTVGAVDRIDAIRGGIFSSLGLKTKTREDSELTRPPAPQPTPVLCLISSICNGA
jgi:hypothetical protein